MFANLTTNIQKYGLIFSLITFTLLGLLYDLTVPLFEKPDELKHFALIQYIQTHHRLPVVQEGVYQSWDQEGTQPPVYHILAAGLTAWLDLSDFAEPPRNPHYIDDRSFVWRERGNNNLYLHAPDEMWSLNPVFIAARLSRWLSLLAGVGTISLTYFLAQIIFLIHSPLQNRKSEKTQLITSQSLPEASTRSVQLLISNLQSPRQASNYQPLPLLAAALVAFIPQFLHVSSAISNDSLSVTLAAAGLVLLVLILKKGLTIHYVIPLGVILGLGAITKLSLLYLFPLTGLVILFSAWRQRTWKRFFTASFIISGLILLIAGWWYGRNWLVYDDPTALNAHLLYRGGPLNPRPTLTQIWQTELVGLELSFWAAFGAGQILLEPWLYTILRCFKYLLLLGLLLGFWRLLRHSSLVTRHSSLVTRHSSTSHYALRTTHYATYPFQLLALSLLTLWSLLIFIALLRWMQITPASWGRLLYPALPALGVLSAWSLSQFTIYDLRFTIYDLRFTIYDLRILMSLIIPFLIITCLFTLSLISPFRYLQTAYAKTPLIAKSELPDDTHSLELTYDGVLRLIAYRIETATVQPGDWLPVTLYWQATQPITKNYSSFVHLLDAQGEAIAQTNTYPDGGNWPTSMLVPGQVLADTYYVFIPLETEAMAPLLTWLAMGIFEFEDPNRAAKVAVNVQGKVVEPIVEGIPLLPHRWPTFNPQHPLIVDFGGQIRLIGYDWVYKTWEPGAQVPITFYWETLSPPGQNLNLFIHLIDPTTHTQVAGFDAPPPYPTVFWQTGTTISDTRNLTLPPNLPPGNYPLLIGWYNLDTFARLSTERGDAMALLTVMIKRSVD